MELTPCLECIGNLREKLFELKTKCGMMVPDALLSGTSHGY